MPDMDGNGTRWYLQRIQLRPLPFDALALRIHLRTVRSKFTLQLLHRLPPVLNVCLTAVDIGLQALLLTLVRGNAYSTSHARKTDGSMVAGARWPSHLDAVAPHFALPNLVLLPSNVVAELRFVTLKCPARCQNKTRKFSSRCGP
jgi:hypothetical protein